MPLPKTVAAAGRRHRVENARRRSAEQSGGTVNMERYALDENGDGIVAFVRDILGGDPAPYQEELLRAFIVHRRVSARGPHGLGKTTLAAWVILYAVAVMPDDLKIVTTASVFRQLKFFLWPEVRKWARAADWAKIGLRMERGKQILEQSIKLPGKEAFAAAPTDATAIEGAHAKYLVYIFDEAKAIPDDVWDAAEGAFSSAGDDTDSFAYALAISTPGVPQGRFYNIQSRQPGYEEWYVRHVTLEEAIAAGRISEQWAQARAKQWGKNSALYKNRVRGEFDSTGEDTVIPLEWVEAAHERWLDRQAAGKPPEGRRAYGVDVARYGEDNTVVAEIIGRTVTDLQTRHKQSTMETAGQVIAIIKGDTKVEVQVDVIGVGAGVVDRLDEQGYNVTGVNVAEKSDLKTADGFLGFFNSRSAYWWKMREALDPDGEILLELPPNDQLTGDLTAPKYTYTSAGDIRVEGKDEIRKRLKRSTDHADGVILAYTAFLESPVADVIVLSRKG